MADSSLSLLDCSVPEPLVTFVSAHMASFECAAHGMDHVQRVCHLALRLAAREGAEARTVLAAALCHDVLDSKLLASGDRSAVEASLVEQLRAATLLAGSRFLSDSQVEHVLFIVKNIGYRHLLDPTWDASSQSAELRCVQDADLLDAIGSTGIARCYAFGGKRNRPLLDLGPGVIGRIEMTPEVYAASRGSGLEHFFEKLLRIPGMMTTAAGAELAQARMARMVAFIAGLRAEVEEGGQCSRDIGIGGDACSRALLDANLAPFLNQLDARCPE